MKQAGSEAESVKNENVLPPVLRHIRQYIGVYYSKRCFAAKHSRRTRASVKSVTQIVTVEPCVPSCWCLTEWSLYFYLLGRLIIKLICKAAYCIVSLGYSVSCGFDWVRCGNHAFCIVNRSWGTVLRTDDQSLHFCSGVSISAVRQRPSWYGLERDQEYHRKQLEVILLL